MFHIIQVIFSAGTLQFILTASLGEIPTNWSISRRSKSFTATRWADKKKKKNASLENSKDGVLKFTQPKM